jgi:hypothetical protein
MEREQKRRDVLERRDREENDKIKQSETMINKRANGRMKI